MRWDTYIPVVNTEIWQVRFCTGGNFEFGTDDGTPRIYTREPVLLEVTLKHRTGFVPANKTIQLTSEGSEFPAVKWETPAVNSDGDSVLVADVTPYAIAVKDGQLELTYAEGSVTVTIPAFETIDGTPPHSLPVRSGLIFKPVAGEGEPVNFITDGIMQYGVLPTHAYVGDIIEVLTPVEFNTQSQLGNVNYGEYKTYYDKIQEQTTAPDKLYQIRGVNRNFTLNGKGGTHAIQASWLGLNEMCRMEADWDEEQEEPSGYTIIRTGQMMQVANVDRCADMLRVTWQSRVGNTIRSYWQLVQRAEDVTDEVTLQTLDGEYAGSKGAKTTVTLRKDGLTASDLYYYASIATSKAVTLRLTDYHETRCKVVTNSVTSQMAETGELFTLDIELELQEYGAY